MGTVSLVLVSHSAPVATGLVDLAGAMAPDVHIGAAGGLPDGGLGTSFDLVERAVQEALKASRGSGVLLLSDLGSATMTIDTVIEFADEPAALRFVDGPLVEGAIAAAVSAQQGGDLDEVAASVGEASQQWCTPGEPAPDAAPQVDADSAGDTEVDEEGGQRSSQVAIVADAAGLHARPAAKIAQMAADFDADIHIDGASALSMIEIMTLAAKQGDKVVVIADGPDADKAARTVANAISVGLD